MTVPSRHEFAFSDDCLTDIPTTFLRRESQRNETAGDRDRAPEWVVSVTRDCPHTSFAVYRTVPNKTPTPAVIPIASAPQKVMRITLGTTGAPPARAATAPKSERKISEHPATI